MSQGYFQVYRDLTRHPSVIALPPSYRCVLWTILDYCCYLPCTQDDHGVLINLKPGQFMCTIRHLAELSNVGRKDAENAIKKLIDIKILGQHLGQRKSIFTVLWGLELNNDGTTSGTSLGQVWDIKEQRNKERRQKKQQQQATASAVVFSCLLTLADESITQKNKEDLTKAYHDKEQIVIDAVKAVTVPGFVPKNTMLQSLRAACKGKWCAGQTADDSKLNKALAIKLEGKRNKYQFEALSKDLEIVKGPKSECVKYKMSHQKFRSEVERIGGINIKNEIGE